MICLIPLILLGYSHSVQTSWHHNTPVSGLYGEVQSCQEGVGIRLAASDQWVQVGPQYGYSFQVGPVIVTPSIHGGLGYSNEIHRRRRQISYFNVGIGINIQYDHLIIKGGYEHMSNGQFGHPSNHGQDMLLVGGGYVF